MAEPDTAIAQPRTATAEPAQAANLADRRTRRGLHPRLSGAVNVLACLVVWCALVMTSELADLSPATFVRIPLEGLAFVALVLLLGPRWRRVIAVLFGLALGVLVVLSVLDYGFGTFLDRPFDPLIDWKYFGSAVEVFADSVGHTAAVVTAVAAGLAVAVVLVVLPLSALRVSGLVARHRPRSTRGAAALTLVWALCAVSGLQLVSGAPVASVSAATMTYDEVSRIHASLVDRRTFATEISADDFDDVPAARLVSGLQGKDVMLVFVESYGRVAVEGSSFSPEIAALLDSGTRRLRAAGFSSQSAWLTSPTYGAASWLAHSSLQSGLWVDSERRYEQLLGSDRLTLTDAFGRAGWRTVFDVPANTRDWPEGAEFYDFDHIYDSRNVAYDGPAFSYGDMPDQYVLENFRRLELAPRDRARVMAEIDLVSSHHPWAPVPRMVPWQDVGDGSVFESMPEQGESPDVVFRDEGAVREVYGESIEYSLTALISFIETYPDPDRVYVVLGDHQPHSYVSGDDAGHDVPITVIAADPAVMDRIADWGWVPGMRPTSAAPVWQMDGFRDRFFTAFGSRRPAVAQSADSPSG